MAAGWMELELGAPFAQREPSRHWQPLHAAEPQRTASTDVVLLVELAQLALSLARLARQPLGARFPAAQGGLREGEAAEQMIPVDVGGE